jgi:hypothetical protein
VQRSQFDFLNDDFTKLPQSLQDIINDPEKRKKLVIYINPPYAEGDTFIENKNIRRGVAYSQTYEKYKDVLGEVVSELFIQFLGRIYKEIPNCIVGTFSTLKYLNSPKSAKFRRFFKAKAELGFLSIGNTFDNVIGKFPIGFIIWNLNKNNKIFGKIDFDVHDKKGNYIGNKLFVNYNNQKFINDWLKLFYDKKNEKIGVLGFVANDFQNQKLVFITSNGRGHHETNLTRYNLQSLLIYFAVRHSSPHIWLNHNDQFLFPNKKFINDLEFKNDCFTFSLFSEKNQIKSNEGINHWIPFTEKEVNPQGKFASHFMTDFIKGKLPADDVAQDLHERAAPRTMALVFSAEATAVFDAGRALWTYYHAQQDVNVNASLYDIREHFQGRNDKGRMNPKSGDPIYSAHIAELRLALSRLAAKLQPKVYEYEFLKA